MRLVVMLAVSACTAVCAQPAWQPDQFPISYWFGPPATHNTLETWQMVKDCNFTFCGPRGYSAEENKKMLDLCARVGIKAMVTDGRLTWEMVFGDDWQRIIAEVVHDYGAHPALYGYYLQDEPNYAIFGPLGQVVEEAVRQDPDHLIYINLFPTYASAQQLGNPTYADHLDKYLSIVKPQVLSYDHYCLLKNGTDRADYFENLALIREYGQRYGVPPWNIILSLPHLGYRDPTEGEMRWQAYTSLAYGMKGIMWFTYWTDPAWEQAGEIAIVDSQGKPARLYPIVQQVNSEILALGKTLLGLESTGVYHTGAEIPAACTRLGTEAIVQVPQELPLVVGFFEDPKGQPYAMVVNRNHDESVEVPVQVRPHVTAVTLLPADGGEPAALDVPQFVLSLPAGGGALLRLTTEFTYAEPIRPLEEISFQFDTEGETEGWGEFNALSNPRVSGGTLTLDLGVADPLMCRRLLKVEADRYTAIKVRMRVTGGAKEGQLFWGVSNEPGFSDTRYLNFPIQPDGEWHEYTIPVAEHPRWRGQGIRSLRLDPTLRGPEGGGVVEIDWIVGE